jgi:DNA polymerase-3 subunit delta'
MNPTCPTICGHEFNRKFLDKQVNNLTAQSFVFVGPEQVGRKLIALDFAKKLMCQELTKNEACGKCSSCISLTKNLNPDIFEVSFSESIPEEGIETSDGEDKEDEEALPTKKKVAETKDIKVEQIKPLLEFLQYKPQISQKRVAIIDNAERLSIEACSYLLKTVEEPPPGSILIFLATDIKRLPDTIVSRLLKINFQEVSTKQIEVWLNENYKGHKDLLEIAWRSHGLPGMAVSLINNVTNLTWFRQTDKEFLNLLTSPFYKQSPFLDKMAKLNSSEITKMVEEWLFLIKYYLEAQSVIFKPEGVAPKLTKKELANLASDLSTFIDWNKRSGINKRLWLENTFLQHSLT